jgi:hypothetical protein
MIVAEPLIPMREFSAHTIQERPSALEFNLVPLTIVKTYGFHMLVPV